MSRLGGTKVLTTTQVKRAAVSDLTAVLNYGADKRSKLSTTTAVGAITEIDEIENMTDTVNAATDTPKRANFSALTVGNPNGVNKISPNLASAKPGSAKKLVIKNFKSKRVIDYLTSKSAALPRYRDALFHDFFMTLFQSRHDL